MKLTANERRALAELAKPMGTRDYNKAHGRTIHALERKGLFGDAPGGKPGGAITAAGRAELKVPNIFDDLFAKRKTSKMSKHPSIEITIRGPQSSGKSTIAAAIRDMLAEADIAAAVVGNEEPEPDGKAIERLYDLRGGPRVVILTSTEDGQRRDMAIADAVLSVLKNNGVNAGEAIELAKTIMAAIERAERNRP